MDHIVLVWQGIERLVTVEDWKDSAIFVLAATLAILWYEIAIPVAMIAAAFWLLSNKYYHRVFTVWEPDVKRNVEFIRFGATMTVE